MSKAEQRRAALCARQEMTQEERRQESERICRSLAALPELNEARTVLSYQAVGAEADLAALHGELLRAGKNLVFPVCGADGAMEAWEPLGPLQTGRFGIPEPDLASARRVEPEELDLVLAPCVAFDGENRRLGRGAGYYDRYLARCPQALRVAVAFEAQRLAQIEQEEHDRAMDLVVTGAGVFRRADKERGTGRLREDAL